MQTFKIKKEGVYYRLYSQYFTFIEICRGGPVSCRGYDMEYFAGTFCQTKTIHSKLILEMYAE